MRLNQQQNPVAFQYAQLLDHAYSVFGGKPFAEQWLNSPCKHLEGQIPFGTPRQRARFRASGRLFDPYRVRGLSMNPLPWDGKWHAWRLDREAFKNTWASGVGAQKAGGRWNPPGRRIIYASADPSTAILEVAAHAGFDLTVR